MQARPTPFGKLLRQLRTEANLTRRELAARSGVSARTIADLERGISQRPMPYTLRRLVDALALDGDIRTSFEAVARGRPLPPTSIQQETVGSVPTTLPTPVSPFIGRSAEIEEVGALLRRPAVRMLTLTGTGGVGKTRIAIEAARAAACCFPDGVFFIPLASLDDPALLFSTLAYALGIKETAGVPIRESLVRWLRPKQALLLLDNLEHLVAAGPAVLGILEACPTVSVLATSRVVLHLSGEYLFPLSPMTLPPDRRIEPGELARYDATALFVERARAAAPDLAVARETAPLIAAICRRLDGLPLAIELAAAQGRFLPPDALLARLSLGTEALGSGPRDAPARQRTLHDTLAWSYDLLLPDDQQLLARLSVFAGGFTPTAAQAVCGSQAEDDVALGLARLQDASLVGRHLGEEIRFVLLETIRGFAGERLQEHDEQERQELRRRHAAFYSALAEGAWRELYGPRQKEWHARLEIEHANLRAAISWLLENDVEQALHLSARLGRCALYRGQWEEEVVWLEAALDRAPPPPSVVRGRALDAYGWLQFFRGNRVAACEILEDSVTLLRHSDDHRELITAMYSLGVIQLQRGKFAEARESFEEILAQVHDPADDAEAYFRRSALGMLGELAWEQGNLAEAQTYEEDTLAAFRQAGDVRSTVIAGGNLAKGLLSRNDLAGAMEELRDGMRLLREGERWQWVTGEMLSFCAQALTAGGQTVPAITLWAASRRTLTPVGYIGSPREQEMEQHMMERARSQVDQATWQQAWETGEAMTQEEAVDFALAQIES